MINKKKTDKIKEIVKRYHKKIMLAVIGTKALTPKELIELKKLGIGLEDQQSLVELAYKHNYLNTQNEDIKTITAMEEQQKPIKFPKTPAFIYATAHANDIMKDLVEKMQSDVAVQMSGYVKKYNDVLKTELLTKEKITQKIKQQKFSDLKKDLESSVRPNALNWERIIRTELSNAVGAGSADTIAQRNIDTNPDEIYVYRIITGAGTCPYCRKFYSDKDGSPKLHRFSTIAGNATNFGKKAKDWLPVIGATHPSEMCSSIVQLSAGYKVELGGKQTFIGMEAWPKYILKKVKN